MYRSDSHSEIGFLPDFKDGFAGGFVSRESGNARRGRSQRNDGGKVRAKEGGRES